MSSYFPKVGRLIGVISMLVILLSSFWLIWNGETNIRYSGDHEGTMSFGTSGYQLLSVYSSSVSYHFIVKITIPFSSTNQGIS